MITVLMATIFLIQATPACPQADSAMMAMSPHDFDQTDAGWRSLDREGCEAGVADVIARFRAEHAEAMADGSGDALIWHEGQLRAAAGQTEAAITLLLHGRDAESDATQPYVDATVAFLRRDRPALLAARERLMALPVPPRFQSAVDRFKATYPDLPAPTGPLNLDKVDGFIACFDRPYSEAYVCDAEGNTQ